MAGKHTAVKANAIAASIDAIGQEFNPKNDKAYAEGRGGYAASPEPVGSPAAVAHAQGVALLAASNQQFETDVG